MKKHSAASVLCFFGYSAKAWKSKREYFKRFPRMMENSSSVT